MTLFELAMRNQGKRPDYQRPITPPIKVKTNLPPPRQMPFRPAVVPSQETGPTPGWVESYLTYVKSELGFAAVVSTHLIWNGLRAMRYGHCNRLETDTVEVARMLKHGGTITLVLKQRNSEHSHTTVLTASDFAS